MADCVDAFFAKRDRRRCKQTKLQIFEVAGHLEPSYGGAGNFSSLALPCNGSRSPSVHDAESVNGETLDAETASVGTEQQDPEDEEWKEFETEQQINLANLKIGVFHLENPDTGDESDDANDDASSAQAVANPWKVVDEQEEKSIQETICEAVDSGADMDALKAKVTSMNAKALLKMQEARELQPSLLPRGGGRKKAVPNVKNEEAFPTLANAKNSGRKANKKAEKGSKNGGPSTNTRGEGSGAVYRPPVGGAGAAYKPPVGGAGAVYRPPVRENGVSGMRDSARGDAGASSSGAWTRGGGSSSGALGRGGEGGSSSSGAWERGGRGGDDRSSASGAWGRRGDNGASSSSAWGRGGRGGDDRSSASGAWGRGGEASASSSWASISSRGTSAAGSGASGAYVPPSMRNSNRFGALNDHN